LWRGAPLLIHDEDATHPGDYLTGLVAPDPIGVLVQWSSSVLLLLFFLRLRRVQARGPLLRTWIAAWAVLALSLSGIAVAAIVGMMDVTVEAPHWLQSWYLPGRMLFIGLVGMGAFEAVGRIGSRAGRTAVAVGLAAIGALATIVDQPELSGSLLIAGTLAVFVGVPIAITSIDRRARGGRVPLLASMLLFGLITIPCLVAAYFGRATEARPGIVAALADSGDYVTVVALLVLGAAVTIMVLEDTARGARHLEGSRARDHAEAEARLAAATAATNSAVAAVRASADADRVAFERRLGELSAPSLAPVRPSRPRAEDPPVPMRAPPVQARSVTLPAPPHRGDGTKAEVLLVDDEAEERSALARIFGRGGWAVREASTAEEALAWLLSVGAHTAPAVVLCDLGVAGMGGRGMYDHLRRERPEFLARLIFSLDDTADASDIDFLAAARCQSVRKPFAVGDIGRAVEIVLGPAGG